MSDTSQIKVGKNIIGIIGLKSVFKEIEQQYSDKSDDEIKHALFEKLCKRNYIPDHVKKDYAKAFLREFCKFAGKPFEEAKDNMLDIKVLGVGCFQCSQMEKDVIEVLAEYNIEAALEHITDIKEIAKYGAMGMPALVVNGQVVWVGSIPPKIKLRNLLRS